MATKILIPTPLRPYTDKKDAVEADGATVGELLADLTTKHAGLKAHLYNEQGKLRSFVNVYLNDEDIRYLQKEQTPVTAGRHDQHHSVGRRRRADDADAGRACRRCRRTRELAAAHQRRDQALQPASDHAGGRRRRAAQAEGRQRAVHRRGRARIAGGDVSRRGRRRHASASSTSTSSTSATCSGRSFTARRTSAGRSWRRRRIGCNAHQPARRRSRPTRRRCRRRTRCELFEPYDVILDGTDNFPTRYLDERRVRAARQAERLRQHLPVRRAGVGVRDQGRSVLSLPVSRAAAAGPRAELRRRRRARRAAGRHRRRSRRPRRSS